MDALDSRSVVGNTVTFGAKVLEHLSAHIEQTTIDQCHQP